MVFTQETFSHCETRCNGGGAHSRCYEGESATVHATPANVVYNSACPKENERESFKCKALEAKLWTQNMAFRLMTADPNRRVNAVKGPLCFSGITS